MHQQSHNKCVEVTHWLKKYVCILRQFLIFPGEWNLAVLLRSGIHEGKFTPALFQEWYEYFLVQIKCSGCWKVISSYVWCCKIHLSCYCDKNRKTGISFVSSIGPNHPISEIATSHVYMLKKTRNESDRAKIANFLNQKSENTLLYILWVSSDWVVAVR